MPVKNASPKRNVERLIRRRSASRRIKRLCRLQSGVSPAIIERQKAILSCHGSDSEFRAFNILAMTVNIVCLGVSLVKKAEPMLALPSLDSTSVPRFPSCAGPNTSVA